MHSDPLLTIRANVRRLMVLRGITADTDLAEQAGVNQSTIWKLLKADPPKSPKLETLEGVASALRVAVWELAMPNLPVGSEAVNDLRGGLSAQGMMLCAIFHRLPEPARRELLSYAEYQANRQGITDGVVDEVREALAT